MAEPNPLTESIHNALASALTLGIALGSHGELANQTEALAAYTEAVDTFVATYLGARADLTVVA